MDFIRSVRETSARALGNYSANAALFTLKGQMGPFLKAELGAEQLNVDGLTVRIKDLEIDENAVNRFLPPGVEIAQMTISSLSVDAKEVKCSIRGVRVRCRARPEGPLSEARPETRGNEGAEKTHGTTSPSGALGALNKCVSELCKLLDSYLEVTLSDIEVSWNDGGDGCPLSQISVASTVFRDSTAERYYTERLDAPPFAAAAAEVHKMVEARDLRVLIRGSPILVAEGTLSIGLQVARDAAAVTTIEAEVGNVRVCVQESNKDDYAALFSLVTALQEVGEVPSGDATATALKRPSSPVCEDEFFDCEDSSGAADDLRSQTLLRVGCSGNARFEFITNNAHGLSLSSRDTEFRMESGCPDESLHISSREISIAVRPARGEEELTLLRLAQTAEAEAAGEVTKPFDASVWPPNPNSKTQSIRVKCNLQQLELVADADWISPALEVAQCLQTTLPATGDAEGSVSLDIEVECLRAAAIVPTRDPLVGHASPQEGDRRWEHTLGATIATAPAYFLFQLYPVCLLMAFVPEKQQPNSFTFDVGKVTLHRVMGGTWLKPLALRLAEAAGVSLSSSDSAGMISKIHEVFGVSTSAGTTGRTWEPGATSDG